MSIVFFRIATLAKSSTAIKAHLVETVLTVVTQNQLTDVSALHFLSSLVRSTQLKVSVKNDCQPLYIVTETTIIAVDRKPSFAKHYTEPPILQDLQLYLFARCYRELALRIIQLTSMEYVPAHTCRSSGPDLPRHTFNIGPKASVNIPTF